LELAALLARTAAYDKMSAQTVKEEINTFKTGSFLIEQCRNVIENKGSLWKTPGLGWNVYENKGDTRALCVCR
jgi:hypothetical protein